MNPQHHLDATTLVSYAAGALSPELSAITHLHLDVCAVCRNALHEAEGIGGALIEKQLSTWQQPRAAELQAQMLQRLDEVGELNLLPEPAQQKGDPDRLPRALEPYFGTRYSALKWRWMGPGMHYISASGPTGGTLLMLRIGPGKRMPVHSHQGSELTQILQGAYDDALGHFGVGDVADLDSETEHQPITSTGDACICVSALDAPLRFPGWFARALQPLYGF